MYSARYTFSHWRDKTPILKAECKNNDLNSLEYAWYLSDKNNEIQMNNGLKLFKKQLTILKYLYQILMKFVLVK